MVGTIWKLIDTGDNRIEGGFYEQSIFSAQMPAVGELRVAFIQVKDVLGGICVLFFFLTAETFS